MKELFCVLCDKRIFIHKDTGDLFSREDKGCCSSCYKNLSKDSDRFQVFVNVRRRESKLLDLYEGVYVKEKHGIAYDCGDFEDISFEEAYKYKKTAEPKRKRVKVNCKQANYSRKALTRKTIADLNNKEIIKNEREGVLTISNTCATIDFEENIEDISFCKLFLLISEKKIQFKKKNYFNKGSLLLKKKTLQLFWLENTCYPWKIRPLETGCNEIKQETLEEFSSFLLEKEFLTSFLEINYFDKVKLTNKQKQKSEKVPSTILYQLSQRKHLITYETRKDEMLSLLNFFQHSCAPFIKKFSKLNNFFDPFAGKNNIKNVFARFYTKRFTLLTNEIKVIPGVKHDFNFNCFDRTKLETIIQNDSKFPETLIFSPPFFLIDVSLVYFLSFRHFKNLIIHVPFGWDHNIDFGFRSKYLEQLQKEFKIAFYVTGIPTAKERINKFLLLSRTKKGSEYEEIPCFNHNYRRN
eukprot:maker-scaffold_5-snap-gene-18.58-mRNA-1 protein AED:0.00 eAED:0.00 QI:42/1/1/1/1/1/2/40/465